MGPDETVAPLGNWTKGVKPAGLPGAGLAQHPMLYAGESYNQMFIVSGGKVVWTYATGGGNEYDDVWMLSNGNILFSRMQYVAEVTPEKKVVWRYDCLLYTSRRIQLGHRCADLRLVRRVGRRQWHGLPGGLVHS